MRPHFFAYKNQNRVSNHLETVHFQAAVLVMAVGSLTGWLSFEGWPEGTPYPSGTVGWGCDLEDFCGLNGEY